MNKKEIKAKAFQIAELENSLQTDSSLNNKEKIEEQMIELTKALSFEDLLEIDLYILKHHLVKLKENTLTK